MRAGDIQSAWTRLPLAGAKAICGTRRTLILAPHPDDESLGCGGLIAELCRAGQPPLVVILTDGTGSHPHMAAHTLRQQREAEAADAVRRLGLDDPAALVFLRLPDAAAPHDGPDFNAAVDRVLALSVGCGTICAAWGHDPHCDHEASHKIAAAVAARGRLRHVAYPVWGWTLPPDTTLPDRVVRGWRLGISRFLPRKRAAIAAHRSQHGDMPDGFALPPALLAACTRPYEVFLQP